MYTSKHMCQLKETYCYETTVINMKKKTNKFLSIHGIAIAFFYACGQFFRGLKLGIWLN